MSINTKSMSGYLHWTGVIFENFEKTPIVKTTLGDLSYDEAKVEQGRSLLAQVRDLHMRCATKRYRRSSQGETVKIIFKDANKNFTGIILKMRRDFSNDPETYKKLGLGNRIERSGPRFIDQATHFFEDVLSDPSLVATLEPFGWTVAILEAGLAKVTLYVTALGDMEKVKGECQSLVEERTSAYKTLRFWMTAFVATCKLAFRENRQVLEELGVFMRNNKLRKKPKTEEPVTEPTNPPTDPVVPPVDPGSGGETPTEPPAPVAP